MTGKQLAPGGISSATERPAFTLSGETFSWSDVVTFARLRGDWQALEHEATRGLASLRRLTASGEELAVEDTAEVETRFRGDRMLFSGEETSAWLERWQLTVSEWRDYFRRVLVRERWAAEVEETAVRFPVSPEEVAAVMWAEAVCSGFLAEAVHRLAGDAALAVDAGETIAGHREQGLRRLAAAADRSRAEMVTDEAVAHEVERHALEWLRVECQLVELPTEDMAREVSLCVRNDGRPLAEVAVECGSDPRALRVYMGEADADLASSLLGADEGELVGPLPWNDGFALVLVETKTRPTPVDPDVRRKAEERVVARIVDRAIAANVSWHEPL